MIKDYCRRGVYEGVIEYSMVRNSRQFATTFNLLYNAFDALPQFFYAAGLLLTRYLVGKGVLIPAELPVACC